MGFKSEMDQEQYLREVGRDPEAPVPADVKAEQDKISRAGGLAFFFPLWWSDCPAKLKGWFDRVWTYGYACFYEERERRRARISVGKDLMLCSAGHTREHLQETGILQAIRQYNAHISFAGSIGIRDVRLEILGGMMPGDDTHCQANLKRAQDLGRHYCDVNH